MNVAQKAIAQGQLISMVNGKLDSLHIAEDFGNIEVGVLLHVGSKDVIEGTLRPFNLRGDKSFLADIHGEEQGDVGNMASNGIKLCKLLAGGRKLRGYLLVEFDGWFWREGGRAIGFICSIAGQVADVRSCSVHKSLGC